MSRTRKSLQERFIMKLAIGDDAGCWLWTAYTDPDGYGRMARTPHGEVLAHRISYILYCGPIPEGCEIDHRCRNRACVRPDHLEPVPHVVNVRRGIAGEACGARQRAKSACRKGHPYSGSNLYISPRGDRGCRTCRNEQALASYHRNKRLVSHDG